MSQSYCARHGKPLLWDVEDLPGPARHVFANCANADERGPCVSNVVGFHVAPWSGEGRITRKTLIEGWTAEHHKWAEGDYCTRCGKSNDLDVSEHPNCMEAQDETNRNITDYEL